jgi:cobalt/nickel transport system permease protein
MTLAFDLPGSPPSALSRLDPRWKVAALFLAAAVAAALRHLAPALLAVLGAWLLLGLARLPLRWYLARLALTALFLALFVGFLPFLPREHEVPWAVGPLRLSPAGLELAVLITLKTVAVLTLVLVLWATAPWEVTLKAAHALRVPGLLVQLVALTYRYLFLLVEEVGRLRTALRVRGYRNRANLHSYRTVGHVAGTLLVRSSERAERVGQAMRCRGFDGRFRSLVDFRTRAGDVLAFALIVSAAAGLLTWDLLLP